MNELAPSRPVAAAAADALASARRQLLDARTAAGHWEGFLSSSALSTATASFALRLVAERCVMPLEAQREECRRLSRGGLRWLASHQNADGGWGDTTDSPTNISTTTLCWAALGGSTEPEFRMAEERAGAWLGRAAGSLEPAALAQAINRRYGDDRTFSAPILTLCTLAGRLGPEPTAWSHVAQLPFELAAFPQSWFRFFRLPVVSYALPALIAIGLVRHRRCPTWNPVARAARAALCQRTLHVLQQVQPPGGGFLEATPLTSFVLMSLIGAGELAGPVVEQAIAFLLRSVRADGSWPIDTNLATWVTTLSVNALGEGQLNEGDRACIRSWLLGQQYRIRHPYTGADPGAWAWTDLPGGVPDADDTAGALVALARLGSDAAAREAAPAGIRWLLDVQNGDGGIPTFCRGWGKLPFDRSSPDLTAHALAAWAAWDDQIPSELRSRLRAGAARAVQFLIRNQRRDGAWVPLWFGNQWAPEEQNPTYGTARVVAALRNASPLLREGAEAAEAGTRWLLGAQNADGGWGGAPGVASTIEETGYALQALASGGSGDSALCSAIRQGTDWLVHHTQNGTCFPPSPIGLYFANLWYWERLYPLIATVGALERVYPLLDSPPA